MIRNYQEKSSKIKKEVTLFLITDLHYYHAKDLKKYQMITKEIQKKTPNFVLIGGDLLDSSFVNDEDLLIGEIKKWSQYSKILIGIGNHDITTSKEKGQENKIFFQKLKSIPNVVILDNDILETSDIRFIGVTLPYYYYYRKQENPKELEQFINQKFKESYDDKKINILLIHSSIGLTLHQNFSHIKVLKNVDFILSGHTHNGMVPKILEGVMKNDGIIWPNKKLFPKLVRGKFQYQNFTFIISGGITKLSKRSGLNFLDHFWKHELTMITIKPD